MEKLLVYEGYDECGPHIFPVDIGPGRGQNHHIKLATEIHPKVAQYLSGAHKIRGKTQLLIDAMGASEYWGQNSNGDIFNESMLSHPGRDYGFETFMHYAYPFKHHVNHDPRLAYGDKVILSVYFPAMHRVQLIVSVDDMKCHDVISQVDNGEFPPVSMGCRVPFDICTVCNNHAKNRKEYCSHAKDMMGRIMPNGVQVGVTNIRPKFHDISFVLIPAEKASGVLMKVAGARSFFTMPSAQLGEMFYSNLSNTTLPKTSGEKSSTLRKKIVVIPEEIKRVSEAAPEAKAMEPKLPPSVLNALADFPLKEIFSTMAMMGIDPKPEELQRIVLIKTGQQSLADTLDSRRICFDETIESNTPANIDISYNFANEKVAYILRPYLEKRSCLNLFLANRLDKMAEEQTPSGYPSVSRPLLTAGPVALGLSALYHQVKKKSPAESLTKFDKAIDRHPWLLGLLLTAATGAGALIAGLSGKQPFDNSGIIDLDNGFGYNHIKTGSKKLLVPLAMAPLAYMYSGVQRSRAMRGERIGKFDRFIAERPDIAAIASVLAAPAAISKGQQFSRALKQMTKVGSLYSDFGVFALTSGAKLLPAALTGAMIDATVIKGLSKLLSKKRRDHANP